MDEIGQGIKVTGGVRSRAGGLQPRRAVSRLALGLLAATLAVPMLIPFVWVLSASVKHQVDIFKPGLAALWPVNVTSENYRAVFEKLPFKRYLLNTVFVSTATAILTVVISAMGGFALAHYRFPGRRLVTYAVLGTMLLPGVVLLAPQFRWLTRLGLIDSFAAVILPGCASGLGILMMRQYMMSVPADLLAAARIDGAGEWRVFWTIVMPLVRPMSSALTILTFLGAWNSYLWPLIVLRDPDKFTLTVGLNNIVSSMYAQQYGILMAGTAVSILPIVILFLVLQRQFVSGLTMGSVTQ